jgi:hypothetical protein
VLGYLFGIDILMSDHSLRVSRFIREIHATTATAPLPFCCLEEGGRSPLARPGRLP